MQEVHPCRSPGRLVARTRKVQSLIEAGWKMFSGALQVRHSQKDRKVALKALGAKEEEDA